MNVEASARQEMENALREAVQQQAFELFYQPKIGLEDGAVCGLEALLRWPRPGQANVSPAVFVPILESMGLITEVGNWVITQVCQKMAEWQRAGQGPLQVAVNVSGQQIIEGDLIASIRQALIDNQIDPHWLEIELTESSLMENTAHTIASLQTLKQLGVKVSIDDFGTGYSSLAYLRRFPIDKLKIDIAFIREVTSNPQDAAIARPLSSWRTALICRLSPRVSRPPSSWHSSRKTVVIRCRVTCSAGPCRSRSWRNSCSRNRRFTE